jgi:hypothetical protein
VAARAHAPKTAVFWLLSALRAITKVEYKTYLHQLGSNRPLPEQGILVVWAFFFLNATMIIANNSYRVVGR